MARPRGTLKLSSNIEPTVGAPLDARDRVPTKADLTASGNFPYAWVGMETYVTAEGKKYRLIGDDPTVEANWIDVSGGGDLENYYTKTETNELLEGKVDTDTLDDYYDKTEVDTALSGKVDAVTGKGLSTNDYTDGDKDKLAGITAGAEPNVQSDYSQSDSTADNYIKNKPTLGTAAAKDIPVSGNASTSQVVMGDDTRLTDARTPVSHTHTLSDITNAGTAAGYNATNAVTQNSGDLVTSGAVWTAIDNLPEPLVYKGTLGAAADSPTITSLPTASENNEGWTYLVITEGTYAGVAARVGDKFSCALLDDGVTYQWIKFKAGDPDTDTWRNIMVNGTEKLGSAISSGGVDFVNGTNTTVEFDASGNKIKVNASGGVSAVELTESQYNALTPAQQADETKIYFITDYSGKRDDNLYIVNGNSQISNIAKQENTSGAIVVDVEDDYVKVTSTNNNNGSYGAEVDVSNYKYVVLELDYCTNVFSYFGIGKNFTYSYEGAQVAKVGLSNKSAPYRWVVDITSYTGMYYCFISCGGNARFDISRMFLTNDEYSSGDL